MICNIFFFKSLVEYFEIAVVIKEQVFDALAVKNVVYHVPKHVTVVVQHRSNHVLIHVVQNAEYVTQISPRHKIKLIRSFLVYGIRWYNHMWSMLQWTMLYCKFILIVYGFFYNKNEFLVRWNCLYLCTAIQRQRQLFMLWLWTTAISTSRYEWQIIIPKINKQTNTKISFSLRFFFFVYY